MSEDNLVLGFPCKCGHQAEWRPSFTGGQWTEFEDQKVPCWFCGKSHLLAARYRRDARTVDIDWVRVVSPRRVGIVRLLLYYLFRRRA